MRRPEKEQLVRELSDKFLRARAVFLADYRGLKVSEITSLRSDIRQSDGEFRVVKNRLAKRALAETPLKGLEGYFKGPVAVALSMGDPVLLAKVLTKHGALLEALKLRAGFLAGRTMTADAVEALSRLPSKEELYGRLLGTLMAPVTNMVRVLHAVPEKLARVLKEIEKTKTHPPSGGGEGGSNG